MDVIFILLGFSLLLALVFLIIFILNIRGGQYDDTTSPAVRILFDDLKKKPEDPSPKKEDKKST